MLRDSSRDPQGASACRRAFEVSEGLQTAFFFTGDYKYSFVASAHWVQVGTQWSLLTPGQSALLPIAPAGRTTLSSSALPQARLKTLIHSFNTFLQNPNKNRTERAGQDLVAEVDACRSVNKNQRPIWERANSQPYERRWVSTVGRCFNSSCKVKLMTTSSLCFPYTGSEGWPLSQ